MSQVYHSNARTNQHVRSIIQESNYTSFPFKLTNKLLAGDLAICSALYILVFVDFLCYNNDYILQNFSGKKSSSFWGMRRKIWGKLLIAVEMGWWCTPLQKHQSRFFFDYFHLNRSSKSVKVSSKGILVLAVCWKLS